MREKKGFYCGRLILFWQMLLSPGTTQNLGNDLFLRHKIGKDFKRLEDDWFNGTDIRLGSRL